MNTDSLAVARIAREQANLIGESLRLQQDIVTNVLSSLDALGGTVGKLKQQLADIQMGFDDARERLEGEQKSSAEELVFFDDLIAKLEARPDL